MVARIRVHPWPRAQEWASLQQTPREGMGAGGEGSGLTLDLPLGKGSRRWPGRWALGPDVGVEGHMVQGNDHQTD